MEFKRKNTRTVNVRNLKIGGGSKIIVQSMCNTKTADAEATIQQIKRLAKAGCELVRFAVPDIESANAIKEIKKQSPIPLVADIHFDYRLALASIEAGIDKLRINPGNIGNQAKVRELAHAAKDNGIPIRIGVNAGSLQKDLLQKYGEPTAEALAESAIEHAALLENEGFEDIVLSLKASSVSMTVEACRILADRYDYPLHIGITEAGSGTDAMIKSAAGLGTLLLEGIGDTLRVSMTGDPLQEVNTAWKILNATGVRRRGIELISCPTCARTNGKMAEIQASVKKRLPKTDKVLRVAVMGCAVNGPGEAREADLGIAFGPHKALMFAHGEVISSMTHDEAADALLKEIRIQLKKQ